MLRGAIVDPIANPRRIARSTAPRFITGNEPGNARSTGQACVFGSAQNCVAAPEKILETVDNCACVSRPITTSHCVLIVMTPAEPPQVRHAPPRGAANLVSVGAVQSARPVIARASLSRAETRRRPGASGLR